MLQEPGKYSVGDRPLPTSSAGAVLQYPAVEIGRIIMETGRGSLPTRRTHTRAPPTCSNPTSPTLTALTARIAGPVRDFATTTLAFAGQCASSISVALKTGRDDTVLLGCYPRKLRPCSTMTYLCTPREDCGNPTSCAHHSRPTLPHPNSPSGVESPQG